MKTVTAISKKTIAEAIKEKEKPGFPFKPNEEVYKAVGINKKRFSLILKGELHPTLPEISSLVKYFNLNVNELI